MPTSSGWLSFGERTEQLDALRVDIRPEAEVDAWADIRALQYPDYFFEGIECFHVLEHLLPDEAAAALNELWRVLKPGGMLLVAVPDLIACAHTLIAGNLKILNNIYSPSREPAQQHRWGYTEGTFREALTGAGFERIEQLPAHLLDPHEMRFRCYKPGGA